MANGAPTPTDLVGPLARLWRSVYKKAAEVAEARTQELLKYHVYVYPHGGAAGPPGPAGGDWTLLEHTTITSATAAFSWTAIDQSGGSLVLAGVARTAAASTAAGTPVLVRFNDVATDYRLIRHDTGWYGGAAYNAQAHDDSTDWWRLGFAPGSDADVEQVGSFTAWIHRYARADGFKTMEGTYGYIHQANLVQSRTWASWETYPPQALTKITVSADTTGSGEQFAAPSEFWLYRVGGGATGAAAAAAAAREARLDALEARLAALEGAGA